MAFVDVRYGRMFFVEKFQTHDAGFKRMDKVIVRGPRGDELGTVLTEPEADAGGQPISGDVMRRCTPQDLAHQDRIDRHLRPTEAAFFKEQYQRLRLPMKLVDVDHLFAGQRIVFYFISETRVDFRELVKILASRFRTNIELRQIGARDFTRITGGCGSCGRQLCCTTWKKDLGGITFDMARVQFDNPEQQKLIGVCGKLKCCLKYEYADYLEAIRVLPEVGTRIRTAKGEGTVIARNLTLRMVTVQTASGQKVAVGVHDLQA